jgi:hypothetical protein
VDAVKTLDIALQWLQALSRRDLIGLLALSAPDITLYGVMKLPAVRGNERLREWFGTTELAVTPREAYLRDDRILLIDAGGACVLSVTEGVVTSFLRDERPRPVINQGFRGARLISLGAAS